MHPGNPYAEVERFYASKFPWLITKVGETPKPVIDPIGLWVDRMWRDAIQAKNFVESEPFEARMRTCEGCEHYAADHSYAQDLSRRLTILGGGRYRASGACRIHHWACGLASLIEQPTTRVPVAGCWAGQIPPAPTPS